MNYSFNKTYIILAVIFVLTSVMVSYIIGGNPFVPGKSTKQSQVTQTNAEKLFGVQTTTVTGEILSVQDNIIRVRNDKGVVGEVSVSEDVKINNYVGARDVIKTIETNKNVTLLLELRGDTYQVVTINYVPTIPSLAPPSVSTNPALQKAKPATSGAGE